MLLVTGTVLARPDTVDAVLAASLEHVHRSRTESGCLLHTVHQDVEDPLRVTFLEHWEDRASLAAHFAQPGSLQFVERVRALAAVPPVLEVYEAHRTSL